MSWSDDDVTVSWRARRCGVLRGSARRRLFSMNYREILDEQPTFEGQGATDAAIVAAAGSG